MPTSPLPSRAAISFAVLSVVFVREGAGCMLGLDALASTGPGTGLEFRPLWPPVVAHIDFAWRRGQKLSNAASMFLEDFKAAL